MQLTILLIGLLLGTQEIKFMPNPPSFVSGEASWYEYALPGDVYYSRHHNTAATRDWPRGTILKVCLKDDPDRCVMVRVNDYGPSAERHPDRIIDLSRKAFEQLAPLEKGVIEVRVILPPPPLSLSLNDRGR